MENRFNFKIENSQKVTVLKIRASLQQIGIRVEFRMGLPVLIFSYIFSQYKALKMEQYKTPSQNLKTKTQFSIYDHPAKSIGSESQTSQPIFVSHFRKKKQGSMGSDKSLSIRKKEDSQRRRKGSINGTERPEYYRKGKLSGEKKRAQKASKSAKSQSISNATNLNTVSKRKEDPTIYLPIAQNANSQIKNSFMNKAAKSKHRDRLVQNEDFSSKRKPFKKRNSRQSTLTLFIRSSQKTAKNSWNGSNKKGKLASLSHKKKKSKSRSAASKKSESRNLRENKNRKNQTLKTKEKTFRSQFSLSGSQNIDKTEKKTLFPISSFIKEEDESLATIKQNISDEIHLTFLSSHRLSNEASRERFKSISMLGKICSSMKLRRASFLLAIAYLDKFLDSSIDLKSIKAAAIASLMIALKVQHAQSNGNLVYQMTDPPFESQHGQDSTNAYESCTPKKNQNGFEADIAKQPKLTAKKHKGPNILNIVLSHEEIFSEYEQILCKDEITEMQMHILNKLNFRLELKPISYWLWNLYGLWERFYKQLETQTQEFREKNVVGKLPNLKSTAQNNIVPYLCLMAEICEILPCRQNFPKPTIVVSILYLLLRIRAQFSSRDWQKGFEYFRAHLSKSANAIFVDKSGTNQLFGQYLAVIGLDMRHIVNSCQHVSKFLLFKVLRATLEDCRKSLTPSDPTLYHYSPELYRYFSARIYD